MSPTIQSFQPITSTLPTSGSESKSTLQVRHELSSRTVVQNPWTLRRGLALASVMYMIGASAAAPLGQQPVIQHAARGSGVTPSPLPPYTHLATITPFYVGEDKRLEEGKKVEYLDEHARKDYEIDIKNSKLYKRNGQPFDSARNAPACAVISPDRKLYAKDACKMFNFHHTSFLSGQPVAWAGDMVVDQGDLLYMDRHSGHYKPGVEHLQQGVEHVKAQGVDNEFVVDDRNSESPSRSRLREVMEEREHRHQEL